MPRGLHLRSEALREIVQARWPQLDGLATAHGISRATAVRIWKHKTKSARDVAAELGIQTPRTPTRWSYVELRQPISQRIPGERQLIERIMRGDE